MEMDTFWKKGHFSMIFALFSGGIRQKSGKNTDLTIYSAMVPFGFLWTYQKFWLVFRHNWPQPLPVSICLPKDRVAANDN